MITLAFCLANTSVNRIGELKDPQFPRPVAMGAVQWDSEGIFAQYGCFIRHEDRSMSASAEKFYGIQDRVARSRGIDERTAVACLTNSLPASSHVVGWDLDFDLDVIRAALIRHKPDAVSRIRPQLTLTSLAPICATIVGKQDKNGEAVTPTISEALNLIAPESGIEPVDPHSQAMACRALYVALCAENLISDQEIAA
ncbi:hypothetical protein [Roseibium album]|uniref:hypothetical protein n=1 Tax=Roseibium album TaxID=311410 RepID=UPI00391A9792